MVNTHEKFLKMVMETTDLHEVLKIEGYKGSENDVIVDMLGATADTSSMLFSERNMNGKERTEEEYFTTLVKQMNINY